MGAVAISAVGLGKRYRIGRRKEGYKTLRETLTRAALAPPRAAARLLRGDRLRREADMFWALSDVSFEVERGEAVGIVGRNGAGKSTLLKVLSRITEPSAGYVDINGRVASLLEVGTGFHPELTGRENVLLNGAILGMKRHEVERKFDEIVDFAEVEAFIDTPVKHYSSGMYLRLAFAVAAHLEPEILLVDEVLAVGDAAFQSKCLGKMGGVTQEGRTVVFVSHNLGAMSALCTRGIFLDGGQVVSVGPMGDVVSQYMASVQDVSSFPLAERTDRRGDGAVRVTSLAFTDVRGNALAEMQTGQECLLVIGYESTRPLSQAIFNCTVYNSVGQPLTEVNSSLVDAPFELLPERGSVACRLKRLPLTKGRYWLNVAIRERGQLRDHVKEAALFTVEHGESFRAGQTAYGTRELCVVDQEWGAMDEVDSRAVASGLSSPALVLPD